MVTAISNKIHIWGLKVAFFFANRHTSKEYQRVQWVHSSQAWGLAFVVIIFYHKGLMLVQMLGLDDLLILRSLGGTCVPLSLPLKSQRSLDEGLRHSQYLWEYGTEKLTTGPPIIFIPQLDRATGHF